MQRVLSVCIAACFCVVLGCERKVTKTTQVSSAKSSTTKTTIEPENSPIRSSADKGLPAVRTQNGETGASVSDAVSDKSQTSANAQTSATDQPGSNAEPTSDGKGAQVAVNDAAGPEPSNLPEPKVALEINGDTTPAEAVKIANAQNRPSDWNQWGGSSLRNNVVEQAVPTVWDVGQFDNEGKWDKESGKNIKWAVPVGSQTYGNVMAANGKVLIGTNNGAGYLKRYPAEVDLGVLLCFDEKDGKFLWQDSSEKLHTGRVHDWPLMGICSSPLVEGDRVYYVTSRGEVKCLDLEGFHDGENDGPYKDEKFTEKDEADTIWVLDMMRALGVSQHNMANCSVTTSGDYLFALTSNGVDEWHESLPSPDAASFIAVDKRNGKVLWTDNTPGANVLHGQWSSPAVAVIDGVPQVMFAGGDGWLYSFDARGEGGKAKLLWKFDCNPKESKYTLGGRADRNHLIATPVIYKNKVFIGVGEDPEHGEGVGHLWCIDPTKRGDVSPELVFNSADPEKPIPHKRIQAMVKEDGDFARPNPNSAAVWHYANFDKNGDGKLEFEETMHRTCGTAAIKDDLLFVADFSGLVHCVDTETGKPYWTHDMLAAAWSSPLIAGDCVYIGDEDGEVTILRVSKELEVVTKDEDGMPAAISMGNAVYSTPVVSNGVLYVSSQTYLFAIEGKETAE
jgi:outer membrane protein assembly factor BamB